ncbi:Endochitinase A1 [Phlyctema vagabunda]|uniref:chitinase n=1 Tax=Phlyctema vagabunda TaxID=108571 RepID=A0ABR4PGR3_9HELO
MQHNSWKLYIFAFILLGLLGDVEVQAAKIPLREWLHSKPRHPQGHLRGVDVKISGMEFLKGYVWPRSTNSLKRSIGTLDPRDVWKVTVQRDQLQSMLLQVRTLEAQLISLIGAEFGAAASGDSGAQTSGVVVTVSSDVWALVVNGGGGQATSVQQVPAAVSMSSPLITSATAEINPAISPRVNVIPFLPAPAVDASSPTEAPAAENPVETPESAQPSPAENTDAVQPAVATPVTNLVANPVANPVPLGQGLSIAAPENVATAEGAVPSSTGEDDDNDADELPYYTRTTTQRATVTANAYITVIEQVTHTGANPQETNVDVPSATNIIDEAAALAIVAAASTAAANGQGGIVVNNNMGGVIMEAPSKTTVGGVFIEINSPTVTSEAAQPQAAEGSQTTSAADFAPAQSTASGSTYVFNAEASDNIAVYFGQTAATNLDTLADQCADPSIDIVILSFVIGQLDGGIYPSINFGAACGGQTAAMAQEAPGLLSCPALATQIELCQNAHGKKVLLSIGGATSQIAFTSADEASNFATILWNLFGPVGNVDAELRPLGTVAVDGFDIDNEFKEPANYDVLGSTFRSLFSGCTTKDYYLSSAPQCPFPDASNPLSMLLLCDFVYVQFYNNPSCEIGSDGFDASLKQWSDALQASTLATKPRLFVGAPSFSGAGSSAYTAIGSAKGMQDVAKEAKALGIPSLGGVMFWDGSEGLLNIEDGKDIFDWSKEGLTS